MEGFSIWQLLIVFFILMLLFGTKKLKSMGSDLGESIKGFKDAINTDKLSSEIKKDASNRADQTAENKA